MKSEQKRNPSLMQFKTNLCNSNQFFSVFFSDVDKAGLSFSCLFVTIEVNVNTVNTEGKTEKGG